MSDMVVRQALGACTDYSAYSLDTIWRAVDEVDDRTWPQIAAWRVMATICDDQAAHLKQALAAMMQTWKPTRNSAAESFQTTVQHLIDAMRQDSAAAEAMQPVLVGIADELSDARSHIQALIEQQNHNLAVERAHQANPFSLRAQPHDSPIMHLLEEPYPSPAWRDDLQTQAMTTMQTADARIGSLTGQMPILQALPNARDGEVLRHLSSGDGAISAVFNSRWPLLAWSGITANRLLPAERLSSSSAEAVLADGSVRISSDEVSLRNQPPAAEDPLLDSTATSPRISQGYPLLPGPSGSSRDGFPPPPYENLVMGLRPTGPPPSVPSPSVRQAATGPMVGSTACGRPGSAASRSSIRPGGRAALWASQRHRKEFDRMDPWAVARGGPPVIEASEPTEHDPGPGVIGLDR